MNAFGICDWYSEGLRRINLTLSSNKCNFLLYQVNYGDHLVSEQGIMKNHLEIAKIVGRANRSDTE